eukprot:10646166-Karenia_brevis.AAC.1
MTLATLHEAHASALVSAGVLAHDAVARKKMTLPPSTATAKRLRESGSVCKGPQSPTWFCGLPRFEGAN